MSSAISTASSVLVPKKYIYIQYFLWTNSKYKDFQIIIGDRVLDVHKCVLASRSPVFAAMLTSAGFTETTLGQLDIQDFDYETVEKAIKFCYYGHFDNDIETRNFFEVGVTNLWGLLTFGHKYDIEHLIRASLNQIKLRNQKKSYENSERKFFITSAVNLGSDQILDPILSMFDDILDPILSMFGAMKGPEPAPDYCPLPEIGDVLLVQDDSFKDFKIICEGQEFSVHKAILALKSPVFTQMLDKLAQDGDTSDQLKITHIKPMVFENVIRFLYTGNVKFGAANVNQLELLLGLLGFADRYKAEELAIFCLHILDWNKKQLGTESISACIQTSANFVSKKIFHLILGIFGTQGFDNFKFDINKASKESYWN